MAKDDPERARRLADQLRANLHRRKARSRLMEAPRAEDAPVTPEVPSRD